MKRAWFLVMMLALWCLPAPAQSSGVHANTDVIAVSDIKTLQQRLSTFLVNRRYHEYALYLADDFVRTSNSGKIESKGDVIESFKNQAAVLLSMVADNMQVRVYGDAAIVTLHETVQNKSGDGIEARFSQITETFVRREGRWYLASVASTAVDE
jgi:hypothetical protein